MRLNWWFGFGKADEVGGTEGRRMSVMAGDYGALSTQLGALRKKWRFNFHLQASNLFNHVNPTDFVGIMTSPFFGRATAAAPARRLETGIRFEF